MHQQKNAYLHALAAVLMWSTVASAFKLSLRHLDYLHLLFFSSGTAVITLWAILACQGRLPVLLTYSKRQYLYSAFLGFLNPFLYYIVLFKAYSLLPAQEALSLNYTWPLVLVLLSALLLKQKLTLGSLAALLVSFLGVVVIGTRGDPTSLSFSHPYGASLALGSSLIWASFWIFNLKDEREEVAKLFISFGFGFLYVLVLLGFGRGIEFPSLAGLGGAIYSGLFEMGLTFVVWLRALRLSDSAARVSNLVFLSPFISLFLIQLIVGERILASTLVGLSLIIAGILAQEHLTRIRRSGSSGEPEKKRA